MRAQDVRAGSSWGRRPSWFLRVLTVLLLVLLSVALAEGPPARLPSPELQLASTADPVPPTNVTAVAADRALTISWTASTEGFISGYKVYLDGALKASPASPSTSATVTGLVNGQAYVVTVTTVTTLVGTNEGTTASTPVTGTPRDAVLPAAPTGVSAVRGDSQVTVSWVVNSGDYDADGYRVLRDGVPVTGLLAGQGVTGWTDTTVVNDTTYGYTVQTHDTSNNWSVSSAPVATATPTDLTAPATPTGVVGGRGDGRAGLSGMPMRSRTLPPIGCSGTGWRSPRSPPRATSTSA